VAVSGGGVGTATPGMGVTASGGGVGTATTGRGVAASGGGVGTASPGRGVATSGGNRWYVAMVTCGTSVLVPTTPVTVSVKTCVSQVTTSGPAWAMSVLMGSVFGVPSLMHSPMELCEGSPSGGGVIGSWMSITVGLGRLSLSMSGRAEGVDGWCEARIGLVDCESGSGASLYGGSISSWALGMVGSAGSAGSGCS